MFRDLSVRYPIVQAPMAGVSTPALAAASSNAGALGSLGIGASTVPQARKMIQEARELTDKPINVNVFCHTPAIRDRAREAAWLQRLAPLFSEVGLELPTKIDEIYKSFLDDDEALRMLLDERPEVVSFHFGLPSADILTAFRGVGIKTMASATHPREASALEDAGVDAIVAQGIEAGGHRGVFDADLVDERLSTSVLVRMLASRSKVPIIAAGGIMDGAGIRAALDLGAVGAQLGTAFVLCPESAANASYRENLKSARAGITRLTTTLSGRPARGLVNRFIEHAEAAGGPPVAAYPVAYDAAKQLNAAAVKIGNNEFAAQWAGQGAPLSREMSAADLIATLAREANLIE
ncbi:NAD(P)H-dependent flavin oxidoreductase [Tardiphaga robiniae]|uniref:Nitronate monooxygenase n=1 Tax=Tardiphaga robiniae TaxID=943830 RepID=A0A7G6U9R1_9BRAD|nr:nitronate monooxygenase [Tardiphaga robiniae]QND75743.1 nitronate monooxygenase [Tardiphaga robiniae]